MRGRCLQIPRGPRAPPVKSERPSPPFCVVSAFPGSLSVSKSGGAFTTSAPGPRATGPILRG
eukprot:6234749-Lingulodinium_polyedra.AAC.1